SECTVRLPRTYWCYRAPDLCPPVQPPPSATNGYITFGCMNNFIKASTKAANCGRKSSTPSRTPACFSTPHPNTAAFLLCRAIE
ncbi:MAG: hypothetical protein ABSH22_22540, partial [Tepidisphaeraceae bacterium]